MLTPAGQLHGWLLGVIIWGSLGWQGYAVVMFYFLVGSGVTRIGKAQKEAEGIAEKRSGARGPENVWGSALTATLCAVGVLGLSMLGQTGGILGDTGKMPVPQDAILPVSQDVISLLLLGYAASFCNQTFRYLR